MVLSYITNMISFHQPCYEDDEVDEELTLPIQMPESAVPSSPASIPKHHIISIMDFMRHTRHTMYTQEHRAPNTSKL